MLCSFALFVGIKNAHVIKPMTVVVCLLKCMTSIVREHCYAAIAYKHKIFDSGGKTLPIVFYCAPGGVRTSSPLDLESDALPIEPNR